MPQQRIHISSEEEDLTFEEYLKKRCEQRIAEIMEDTKLKIEFFKKGAEEMKKEILVQALAELNKNCKYK